MKKSVIRVISVVFCLLFVLSACAQKPAATPAPSAPTTPAKTEAPKLNFPTKPITFLVANAPGGSTDLTTRAFTKVAQKYLGQPAVVQNISGAGGIVGYNQGYEAAPDGYTITVTGSTAITAPIVSQTKYNYMKDMRGVLQLTNTSHIMVVTPDSKYQTIADVVTAAKAKPKTLTWGHSGIGNNSHILGMKFQQAASVEMEAVPFNSGSELVTALLGKHIDIAIVSPMDILAQVKAAKAKVIATGSDKRWSSEPDYKDWPTLTEQGIKATTFSRMGLAVPKGTPDDVYKFLCDACLKISKDSETVAAMKSSGAQIDFTDGPTYSKLAMADQESFVADLKATGVDKMIAEQNAKAAEAAAKK